MGTPSYMAPEQAGGQSKEVGPAADVYALGAILYELLTGRPPFQAATPLDTLLQVVSDEPVPPRQLQSKVPRDLETICLKCLRKEPRSRYATARRWRTTCGASSTASRSTARLRWAEPAAGWRWCRRNPLVAGLTAAVFCRCRMGLGVASWFAVRGREEAMNLRQASCTPPTWFCVERAWDDQ